MNICAQDYCPMKVLAERDIEMAQAGQIEVLWCPDCGEEFGPEPEEFPEAITNGKYPCQTCGAPVSDRDVECPACGEEA